MAKDSVDSRQLISNMFAGVLKSLFPDKESSLLSDIVNKAVIDRDTEHSFISVSRDNKNITLLGYNLPDDAVAETHANVDRYGILTYRDKRDAITFMLLDEGVTTSEAQNRAVEMVENNRNNIYYARVFVGVPWTFGSRPVFRGFVSFYVLSKSLKDVKEPVDFTASVKKAQDALAKGPSDKSSRSNNSKKKKVKFTTEPWVDPTVDLSIDDLSKCVPSPIVAWAKRVASAQNKTAIEKSALLFPYKSVDGLINLNAVNAILKADGPLADVDLPPSVVTATKAELKKLLKETASITRKVSFIGKEATLERGLVYGLVYEPLVKDTEGDFATAQEIETAAHNYLPAAMLNIQHDDNQMLRSADSVVVESYIAPCDFELDEEKVTKGSWVLVTKVYNEELLDQIRKGEITGYSLQGTAFRV